MFLEIEKDYQLPAMLLKSIVFPEAIRFSVVQNFLEVTSMEILYVNTGVADFSVGSYQVKPSFAEKIEGYARDSFIVVRNVNPWFFEYKEGKSSIEERRERLQRLKNPADQLQYIAFFIRVMFERFPELKNEPEEYIVRFLAAAYNSDFEAEKEEIAEKTREDYFPWGAQTRGEKYNYSEISLFYFRNYN